MYNSTLSSTGGLTNLSLYEQDSLAVPFSFGLYLPFTSLSTAFTATRLHVKRPVERGSILDEADVLLFTADS